MTAVYEAIPRRATAIGAHPDDVEWMAGATLARWIAAGCEATLVVCTDGSAGTAADGTSRATVAAERRHEQEAAARELGVARLEMLDLPDGGLEDTPEFRGAIVQALRRYQPEIVLTHDARTRDRLIHRDHRIVGAVVEDAVYPFARDRLHYPQHLDEGLAPHKAAEVWLWDSDAPNVVVPVDGCLDSQATALQAHRSQLAGIFGPGADVLRSLTVRARTAAEGHAFPRAEAFRRLIAPA